MAPMPQPETENEVYTFVVLTHGGHQVGNVYCNRREADANFNALCADAEKTTAGLSVAYYCASVGGLVNFFAKS